MSIDISKFSGKISYRENEDPNTIDVLLYDNDGNVMDRVFTIRKPKQGSIWWESYSDHLAHKRKNINKNLDD